MKQRAVSFAEKTRDSNTGAFPFLYSFLGYPYQSGAISAGGFSGNTVAEAEGPDGISIPFNVLTRIPITMDRDANFHMLWMRYTVHNSSSGFPLEFASRHFLVGAQTANQGGRTQFQAANNQLIPWNSFVDVSVYISSIGARGLYGDMAKNAQSGAYEEIRVPITAMQTSEDGIATVRMPYQVPKDGVIMVKALTTTNPAAVRAGTALRIHGHIFGYKVPL